MTHKCYTIYCFDCSILLLLLISYCASIRNLTLSYVCRHWVQTSAEALVSGMEIILELKY